MITDVTATLQNVQQSEREIATAVFLRGINLELLNSKYTLGPDLIALLYEHTHELAKFIQTRIKQ